MKLFAFQKAHRRMTALGLICTAAAWIAVSCTAPHTPLAATPFATGDCKTPKYIILLIGDGMSYSQISLAEAALKEGGFEPSSAAANRQKTAGQTAQMNIRQFPVTGMATTHAENRYITCSAAAGTALATGYKTTINTISMNPERTEKLQTLAEMAHDNGMKVGIVSSVSIDHATPACFYAHVEDRNDFETIGNQLLLSGFDYFAGGSPRWNKRATLSGASEFAEAAAEKGYRFVDSRSEFEALDKSSGKVIATLNLLGEQGYTDDSSALPYAIDGDNQRQEDRISLADFTRKGLEVLDNENGFFLMVESGKIDWACHANDAATTIHELLAFDRVIGETLDFYRRHPDQTLIVLTGDHETGGLTLGFSMTDYETSLDLLRAQTVSFQDFSLQVLEWSCRPTPPTFEQALAEVTAAFGLRNEYTDDQVLPNYLKPTHELSDYECSQLERAFHTSMIGKENADMPFEEMLLHYGIYDPFTVTLTHILNNKAGIEFGTYAHTGVPVPIFAIGAGQDAFCGYYDNTDIAKKIRTIARWVPR